jgi:hypothetical protein
MDASCIYTASSASRASKSHSSLYTFPGAHLCMFISQAVFGQASRPCVHDPTTGARPPSTPLISQRHYPQAQPEHHWNV